MNNQAARSYGGKRTSEGSVRSRERPSEQGEGGGSDGLSSAMAIEGDKTRIIQADCSHYFLCRYVLDDMAYTCTKFGALVVTLRRKVSARKFACN